MARTDCEGVVVRINHALKSGRQVVYITAMKATHLDRKGIDRLKES